MQWASAEPISTHRMRTTSIPFPAELPLMRVARDPFVRAMPERERQPAETQRLSCATGHTRCPVTPSSSSSIERAHIFSQKLPLLELGFAPGELDSHHPKCVIGCRIGFP